ncbi:MAG TPA: DUF2163 domain-containing protein [Sphingobium sp.]|nr:DUF2163 domain-containing protein [Sphingobium sp.]
MSGVAEILTQPLCAFAFCWRLERRDGVTIGLTSHDRPLDVAGLRYAAAPGITPSALMRGGDGASDLADIEGALSAAAITEDDLDAGRWDGATLLLHLTEWTEPGVLWLELARGTLGGVERRDGRYAVTLRGAGALLDKAVAPVTSPTCRARLGDGACRIDMRRHQRIVRTVDVVGDRLRCAGLGAGLYPFGHVRWLGGANAGLVQMIVDQAGDDLFLAEPPAFPVTAGVLALLVEGCDKRLETCTNRFANTANFRGEPHLPGMDLLTRYPGS